MGRIVGEAGREQKAERTHLSWNKRLSQKRVERPHSYGSPEPLRLEARSPGYP